MSCIVLPTFPVFANTLVDNLEVTAELKTDITRPYLEFQCGTYLTDRQSSHSVCAPNHSVTGVLQTYLFNVTW